MLNIPTAGNAERPGPKKWKIKDLLKYLTTKACPFEFLKGRLLARSATLRINSVEWDTKNHEEIEIDRGYLRHK
jgi:hypothetical protein